MNRRSIPMTESMWEAINRRAADKHTSASEIVRQTIREADWHFADQRVEELLRKVAEKNDTY